jgi:ubiquitin conjugation factor E4 B
MVASTKNVDIADLASREPNPDHDTIAPYLLRPVTDENGICFDFIREAIKRFDDDETFPAVFDDAMIMISDRLAGMTMEDDYKPHVQVSNASIIAPYCC